jgi:hypothetical protein
MGKSWRNQLSFSGSTTVWVRKKLFTDKHTNFMCDGSSRMEVWTPFSEAYKCPIAGKKYSLK